MVFISVITFLKLEVYKVLSSKTLIKEKYELIVDNLEEAIITKTNVGVGICNKIGYKIGDRYQFNAQQGYLTQFAYLREKEANKVSENAVKQNLGLLVKCGEFSYAETPKKFDIILGVTGTLE